MSYPDQLLSMNGDVRWATLGDISVKVMSGATPLARHADYYEHGDIPWLRTQEVVWRDIWDTEIKITDKALRETAVKWIPENCVIVAISGATAARAAVNKIPLTTNQHCCNFKIDHAQADYRYVFHWVAANYEKLKSLGHGARSDLNAQKIRDYPIPVPSLEKQREIVRALDSFSVLTTDLASQLDAELEARRLQYAYYRDSLLRFEGTDIRRISFGELAHISRGASPRPIKSFITDSEDGVPWIKIGDVAAGGKYITGTSERITPQGAGKSRRVYPGDFVLSNSMSFGRPYISKIEGCIHDGWLAISNFSESFTSDFLYHLLRSAPVQAEFSRRAGAGTVQNLNADIVRSVEVPVPPIDEQRRIVFVLDQFETLVNDLSASLPAEQVARRKQYEHYRDKLLTFEEPVV